MQYRFSTLVLSFAALAASLVVFGAAAGLFFFSCCFLLIAVGIARREMSFLVIGVACLLLYIVFEGILPQLGCAREAVRRRMCGSQLRQIGIALYCYEEKYGCLPPAYIADKAGKPMHSWRVLILPFLDRQDLFDKYDFSEPWDGPHNQKLIPLCPAEYMCPAGVRNSTTNTSYAAVVGPGSAWLDGKPGHAFQGTLSKTVSVIEVPDTLGIRWTEPRDLPLDVLRTATANDMIGTIHSSAVTGGLLEYDATPRAKFLLANGIATTLPVANLKPDELCSMLTADGFDEEVAAALESGVPNRSYVRIKWANCAALVVWLISSVWLLVRAVRARKRAIALEAASAESHDSSDPAPRV